MTITRDRPRARITSQGQITVPKTIRDKLGVVAGDELEFDLRGDDMVVRPRRRVSILDFAGIGAAPGYSIPATAELLDEVVERGRQQQAIDSDRLLRATIARRRP